MRRSSNWCGVSAVARGWHKVSSALEGFYVEPIQSGKNS